MTTSLARGRAILIAALVVQSLLFASVLLLRDQVPSPSPILLVGLLGVVGEAWDIRRGSPRARWSMVFLFGALALLGIGLGSLAFFHWGFGGGINDPRWIIGAVLLVSGLCAAGMALLLAFSPGVGHFLQHRRAVVEEDFLRRQ